MEVVYKEEHAGQSVPSLLELAARCVAAHLDLLANARMYFPQNVAQAILQAWEEKSELDAMYLTQGSTYNLTYFLGSHTYNESESLLRPVTRMSEVVIRNARSLSAAAMSELVMTHTLDRIEVTQCRDPTLLDTIMDIEHSSLRILRLRDCNVIDAALPPSHFWDNLQELDISFTTLEPDELLNYLPSTLVTLNISSTDCDFFDMSRLTNLETLLWCGGHPQPTEVLAQLVQLPKLQHLDISDCETLMLEIEDSDAAVIRNFFDGLVGLPRTVEKLRLANLTVDRQSLDKIIAALPKLAFVDVVGTDAEAAGALDLPPRVQVATTRTVEGLKLALDNFSLQSREVTMSLLRRCYQRISIVDLAQLDNEERLMIARANITARAVDAIELFHHDSDVILLATAVLYYSTSAIFPYQQAATRQRVLKTFLSLLTQDITGQITKNCCLALKNFYDFEFTPVAIAMGDVLFNKSRSEESTVRITSIFACAHQLASLSPRFKKRIGETGVPVVLQLIAENLASKDDNVMTHMEGCWTFLWNITDESPPNVIRFIEQGGLSLIEKVFEEHSDNKRLKRTVTGLLTNISEVREVRNKIMSPKLIELLRETLMDMEDMEMAYNSSGTLAHLLGEGGEFWAISGVEETHPREAVLNQMVFAANSWKLGTRRLINYRSLLPLIGLLDLHIDWQIHYWSLWALVSLCLSDQSKYCLLCINEGALEAVTALQEFYSNPVGGQVMIVDMSVKLLELCINWKLSHP